MQLATIASFLMLLCGTFGEVIVNNDLNAITTYDKKELINNDKALIHNSCMFGVKIVSVVMFTRDNPHGEFVNINKTCNRINNSKVIFLSHGFLANATDYNFSDLASGLVEKNYVVYSIDWSDAACYNMPVLLGLPLYPFAADNTHEVGEHLANMIRSVIEVCKVPLSNIILMGHSLGAHVCGFASKNLQKWGYGKPPLLIGTDPASPGFTDKDCSNRFCIKDAAHVAVLHTSAIGIQYTLGHCDFWFNDGLGQPACGGDIIDDINLPCSHNIAIEYLIIMLNCKFDGIPISPRSSAISSLQSGCPSDTTNSISVNETIFDGNYNGDYCVPVTGDDGQNYGAQNCEYQ